MLLPRSIFVCIPCFKFVAQKYHFWLFFGGRLDMNRNGCGHIYIYIYFKHSPDYIDSKYIWVHGLTP